MLPSPHTRLMNCVIGLCKKDIGWPSPLAELGYDVQLIEQPIRTSQGNQVRPDVVATSNKFLHSIVFDCKGGNQVEPTQVSNYKGLRDTDLARWVTVFDATKLSHDICFTCFNNNQSSVSSQIQGMSLIVFGDQNISKTGNFSDRTLDTTFDTPISLDKMKPPLSYYPFSESDDDAVIVPRVLRMIVSIALKTARGGQSALEGATLTTEEITSSIHPLWKALSLDQQGKLRKRVGDIVHGILQTEPEFRNALKEVEGKKGYKVVSTLQSLQREAERISREAETQSRLPH